MGRSVTDHKPLVSIFKPDKSIPGVTTARMQLYALFLSGLHYDIEYKSTTAHGHCLLRLPLTTHSENSEDDKRALRSLHVLLNQTLQDNSGYQYPTFY